MRDETEPVVAYVVEAISANGRRFVTADETVSGARFTVVAIERSGGRVVDRWIDAEPASARALLAAVQASLFTDPDERL